jgi:tRNA pseudouridine38-40 synthase
MLQDAIVSITGERVLPQGSGRTDAGVHAWGQVASFPLHAAIPAENLLRALNRRLPAAVRILSAEPAPAGFHARHSAVGKVYQYRIFPGRICSPFLSRYLSTFRWPLDLEAMQLAANAVLGEHDFTSFAASDPERSARLEAANTSRDAADGFDSISTSANNVRRIETSQWTRELCIPFPGALESLAGPGSKNGDAAATSEGEQILTYTVCGNGFLHHMVRNLVGTFLEVGRGRLAASEITRILHGRNRTLAGPTAAARGLCLVKVLY